ncbi:MAG: hypothetical protein K9M97_09025 [Akkermansiaceae bacterium]|nr:hypothetical protein [Akkermansiaceae bacterium]
MKPAAPAATAVPSRAGVSWFLRWLHRSYFWGAGMSHFLVLRDCPAGLALGVGEVGAGPVGLAPGGSAATG